MFKTSVITASWVAEINNYQWDDWNKLVQMHWDRFGYDELDGLLERIATMGFGWVELWVGHTGDLCRAPLWKGKGPDDILGLFRKHKLQVASFCPGSINKNSDAEPIFEFAKGLQAPMLTGVLGPQPDWWPTMVSLLERYDTSYGIEPHPPEYAVATPEQILAACALSPRFGACPDTGHFAHQGMDVVAAVQTLLPHIIHTHLKGYNRAQKRGCAPGEDDIGLDQVLRLLRDSGYDGVYSIEYEVDHNPDAELKRSREWMLGVLNVG
jgi:sugar phosphate isomerase/epimerase